MTTSSNSNANGRPMRNILIAPDSFKGSLSARDLCDAIATGVRRVLPDARITLIPLADGGEGTVDNLVIATGGTTHTVTVTGPLGTPVVAGYGVLGDGQTAVIEMAQASGLPLVPVAERNPLVTTSFGTGELIRHALDRGFRRLLIGLGGSATNDGGAGMLQALGVQLLDHHNRPLPAGGAALADLARLDMSGLDPRLSGTVIDIACDVTNPLCGPDGASHVFGPQKGATPEMVQTLDAALSRFAEVALTVTGRDIRTLAGGGAAGGMGAALVGLLQGRLHAGIELMMEAAHLDEHMRTADLLITGEGRLDAQTLNGKVIAGVCRRATAHGVPAVALCGSTELRGADLDRLGLRAALPLVPGPCTLEQAMIHTAEWAADRAEMLMRLLVTS